MNNEQLIARRASLQQELQACRQKLQELGALEQRIIGALLMLDEIVAEQPPEEPRHGD